MATEQFGDIVIAPRVLEKIIAIAPPKYKESYIVTMVDKYWAVKEAATPLRNRIKNRKFLRRKTLQSHHQ